MIWVLVRLMPTRSEADRHFDKKAWLAFFGFNEKIMNTELPSHAAGRRQQVEHKR